MTQSQVIELDNSRLQNTTRMGWWSIFFFDHCQNAVFKASDGELFASIDLQSKCILRRTRVPHGYSSQSQSGKAFCYIDFEATNFSEFENDRSRRFSRRIR